MATAPSPQSSAKPGTRSHPQQQGPALAAAASARAAALAQPAAETSPTELGLTERRRLVRPLPAPHAVESQGDSDWAIFQALISDNQKI